MRDDNIFFISCESDIQLVKTGIGGSGYESDGDMQHAGYHYIIAEMKNEIGGGGAEPYAQASLYYLEFTRKQAVAHPGSVIPTLLVLFFGACVCYKTLGRNHLWDNAGPYIVFAGAAWNNNHPNIQVLSSAVPFHYHPSDNASQRRAARHIAAFRRAAGKLKLYYEQGLPAATHADENHPHMYPHPTTYKAVSESTQQHLKYLSLMAGGNLLFECQLGDSRRVCVKFVRRYGQEVHKFCAKEDFVPKLLGCKVIPRKLA